MNQKRNPGRNISSASVSVTAEGLEWDARREQRLQTAQVLGSGRTPLQVIAIAQEATVRVEEGMQTTLARQPPRPPLACAEGCAWCCRKVVGCAAPEVLHIAAYLQEHLSAEQMEATRQRVAERDDERRSLRQDSWAAKRVACPLLVQAMAIATLAACWLGQRQVKREGQTWRHPDRVLAARELAGSDAVSTFLPMTRLIVWRPLCLTACAPASAKLDSPATCWN